MKLKKPARINTAADTVDSESLTARANKIGEVAPTSPIYLNNAPVKSALDALTAEAPLLAAAEAQVSKDEATLAKSRAVRDTLLLSVRGTYGIATTTVEKYATSPGDLVSCGFDPAQRASYPVVGPADLTASYDPVHALVDIYLTHAPGMRAAQVETSTDPISATSWKRQDGIAAEYHLAGFAPGTVWVRARSVRGNTVSDWVGPVAVIVK